MNEYIIHIEDAKTLYGNVDFPFPLDAYLREEIVRCRDCKHCVVGWCCWHDSVVKPDCFCAWGERRES